jgi:hypothetical protein
VFARAAWGTGFQTRSAFSPSPPSDGPGDRFEDTPRVCALLGAVIKTWGARYDLQCDLVYMFLKKSLTVYS